MTRSCSMSNYHKLCIFIYFPQRVAIVVSYLRVRVTQEMKLKAAAWMEATRLDMLRFHKAFDVMNEIHGSADTYKNH